MDKSFKSFTPRLALRYALSDATNVYATYSRGFKSGIGSSFIIGIPPANPEKSWPMKQV